MSINVCCSSNSTVSQPFLYRSVAQECRRSWKRIFRNPFFQKTTVVHLGPPLLFWAVGRPLPLSQRRSFLEAEAYWEHPCIAGGFIGWLSNNEKRTGLHPGPVLFIIQRDIFLSAYRQVLTLQSESSSFPGSSFLPSSAGSASVRHV